MLHSSLITFTINLLHLETNGQPELEIHYLICVFVFVFKFEGVPTYPHTGRFWEIIEKYKVSKFYTAPTAIRTLMKFGDEPVKK